MRENDLPYLVAWVVRLPLWQRYRLTEATLTKQLTAALAEQALLLVAVQDSHPCAFVWCQPGAVFGRSAYLKLIGVKAEVQGQGLGVALLRALEAKLQAQQLETHNQDLFLLVSDFNEAAQRFYRRQGFEKIGGIPGYVLPDVTELMFRKQLLKGGLKQTL